MKSTENEAVASQNNEIMFADKTGEPFRLTVMALNKEINTIEENGYIDIDSYYPTDEEFQLILTALKYARYKISSETKIGRRPCDTLPISYLNKKRKLKRYGGQVHGSK